MDSSLYDYDQRPRQFKRDDFWRQVRRTINGEPVSEDQIGLIRQQIADLLELKEGDRFLDIGCGNGALTQYFKDCVNEILGVDNSKYLIEIANEYFSTPSVRFLHNHASDLVSYPEIKKYNKVMMYGVSSFLEDSLIIKLLHKIVLLNKSTMLLGNVRDRSQASHFYGSLEKGCDLDDVSTSMGKWRTREWFAEVACRLNINVKFAKMPANFYAERYYFDVVYCPRE